MVRGSLVEAVTGLPALITVASNRPSVAPSATRAATPRPATSVAQTSATATTFRWVMRSAVNIEKLFMTRSPQHLPVIGRGGVTEGSSASTGKVGFARSVPKPLHGSLKTRDSNRLTVCGDATAGGPSSRVCRPPPGRRPRYPHEFRGVARNGAIRGPGRISSAQQRCDPEAVSKLKQRRRNREERCRQGSRDNPPLYPDSRGKPAKPSSFVFEGEGHAGAECGDLAVFHLHVHLRHFGHAQVTQRAGCCFHRVTARLLPRFVADTDDHDDLVDRRLRLLLRHGILRRLALARESARRWYQHLRLEPIARRRFLAQRAAQPAAARGPHAGPTQEIAKKKESCPRSRQRKHRTVEHRIDVTRRLARAAARDVAECGSARPGSRSG